MLDDVLTALLSSAPIDYVKWDMNRNITEAGSTLLPGDRQQEVFHRYILGLYRLLDRITQKFPDVLFESCASGGGRFDPGMLYYMPQTWTSDDTDAIERLKIQYGTSLAYPACTMGAHVSAVPNHQVGRVTPLKTRGYAAMSGNFGYELDVSRLSEGQREEIRKQVQTYKQIRHLVRFGDLYRLKSPFAGNVAAWMYVSADQSDTCIFCFRILSQPNSTPFRLKFAGLDPQKQYADAETGIRYGGDELMYYGLSVKWAAEDFESRFWHLKVD